MDSITALFETEFCGEFSSTENRMAEVTQERVTATWLEERRLKKDLAKKADVFSWGLKLNREDGVLELLLL